MIRPPTLAMHSQKENAARSANHEAAEESKNTNNNTASGQASSDAAPMLRALHGRLSRLGLTFSDGSDADSILIAGQAYDTRSAAIMVRQLGRFA